MQNDHGRAARRYGGAALGALLGAALLGTAPSAQEADEREPEIIVRAGYVTAQDGIGGDEVRLWANLVDVNSNGRIKVEDYPAGLLGNAKTQMEGLVTGTHDVFINVSAFTAAIPEQRIWDLPFVFENSEQVARLVDGPLRKDMEEHFREHDMELLGFWGFGFRQFTTNSGPIRVPEDLHGVKHRIPGGKSKTLLFETLGANPTTIAFPELYQALKTGVVDSQDNPLSMIHSSKLHEVTQYLSICNYVYNPHIVAAGKPFWDGLPDWAKTVLKESARDVQGWSRMLEEKSDLELLIKIKEEAPDLQINECDPADLEKWREAAQPVYDAFAEQAGEEWAEKVFRVVNGGYAEE